MSARRLVRWFTSARVTVALLAVLALLLLLNVVIPQERVIGEEKFAELIDRAALTRLFLEGLGLGRMRTSPIFLGVLALFFLNLAAVIAARLGPTWRRTSVKPRSEAGLEAWARLEQSVPTPLPAGWSPGHVAKTLRGHGYVVRRPGQRTFWAVRHRTAPLGFLLFHLSFFLLCAGGVLIYYTRFVGLVTLSEGQQFHGDYSRISRTAPMGEPPDLSFVVDRIETRSRLGKPLYLGADLRLLRAGSSRTVTSRVNHPARWGSTLLLVQKAGLAPILWLQDGAGFTLDRVAVPVRAERGEPTKTELADGRWTAWIFPRHPLAGFPSREELGTTDLRIRVTRDGELLFEDLVRPGEAAELDDARLVLEEIRYWVQVQVVSERGGALLIAGFALGVLGLIWRLLWYRRQVAVTWDDRGYRLVGRSEYFSDNFRRELAAIASSLSSAPGSRPARAGDRERSDEEVRP